MRNVSKLRAPLYTLASATLVASLGAPALAAPQAEPQKYDPYQAPSDVRVRYQALESGAKPVIREDNGFRITEGDPILAKGIMRAFDDGVVVLERAVDKASEEVLLRMGARLISGPSEISDHTLLNGRYYQVLIVAPSREACAGCAPVEGPADFQLEKRVGREVVLELALLSDGRRLVVAVSDPR